MPTSRNDKGGYYPYGIISYGIWDNIIWDMGHGIISYGIEVEERGLGCIQYLFL